MQFIRIPTYSGQEVVGHTTLHTVDKETGTIRLQMVEKISYAGVTVHHAPYVLIGGKKHLDLFRVKEYLIIFEGQFKVGELTTITPSGLYAHLIRKNGEWTVRSERGILQMTRRFCQES